jgi:hypothetical protein
MYQSTLRQIYPVPLLLAYCNSVPRCPSMQASGNLLCQCRLSRTTACSSSLIPSQARNDCSELRWRGQAKRQVHQNVRNLRRCGHKQNMQRRLTGCKAEIQEEYETDTGGYQPESNSPPYGILLALAAGGIAETSYLTLVLHTFASYLYLNICTYKHVDSVYVANYQFDSEASMPVCCTWSMLCCSNYYGFAISCVISSDVCVQI